MCCRAEKRLCALGAESSNYCFHRRLIHVRILGHLLVYGPSSASVAHVASSIVSLREPEDRESQKLVVLGEFYDNHFLRAFRQFTCKCRTPAHSEHLSRPSFNMTKKEIEECLIETPSNHEAAKRLTLARDGCRCMLTGKMHSAHRETVYSVQHPGEFVPHTITECAHIFSVSTNTNLNDSEKVMSRDYTANFWSIIKSFGYVSIQPKLEGSDMHSLQNLLTLAIDVHRAFNGLKLWLEPISGAPNRYRILSRYDPREIDIVNPVVHFTSHTDPPLPLPDPDYLHIHAACCKIALMSGASGLYDQLEQDMESDPDPELELSAFASALEARLEHEQVHHSIGHSVYPA
ncbi:hypothetical protein DENSPDRAFT_778029 [Dentipellis sp. KUC8613]|nr:hypothetical protein DENSPDRAFT_778029 [Dentipellis sp. KUC8613]